MPRRQNLHPPTLGSPIWHPLEVQGTLVSVRSQSRLIAVLSLVAVLLLAVSPAGIGIAAIPTIIALVSPEVCGCRAIGLTIPQATPDTISLLPSRAPPLA